MSTLIVLSIFAVLRCNRAGDDAACVPPQQCRCGAAAARSTAVFNMLNPTWGRGQRFYPASLDQSVCCCAFVDVVVVVVVVGGGGGGDGAAAAAIFSHFFDAVLAS